MDGSEPVEPEPEVLPEPEPEKVPSADTPMVTVASVLDWAVVGTGMLLVVWGGTLIGWWVAAVVLAAFMPALLWMRFVTSKDDQRFRQMFVAMKLRLHDRNRRFWHARSYAPTLYRGARDAWHV